MIETLGRADARTFLRNRDAGCGLSQARSALGFIGAVQTTGTGIDRVYAVRSPVFAERGFCVGLSPADLESLETHIPAVDAAQRDVLLELGDSGQQALATFLAESGDDGVSLLNDVDADTAAGLFTELDRQHRLGRQVEAGDLDAADAETLLRILETQDQSPLYAESITESKLLDVSQDNDLSKTEAIAENEMRDGESQIVRLQHGSQQYGWLKILRKHVNGELTDSEIGGSGINSFFPTGKTVEIEHQDTMHTRTLPDTMDESQVKRLIAKTLNEGEGGPGSGERTEFIYELDDSEYSKYGMKRVLVSVEPDGKVVTAHPKKGSDVVAWVSNEGKFGEYDGGGDLLLQITRVLRTMLSGGFYV